jgi:DNA-binding MarR family transcriptional regulator
MALRVVRRHPGCRVEEIRQELGITVGAASKLVDRLERDGLAVRSANPSDRRSSLVALTAEGDAVHDEGVVLVEQELGAHLAGEGDVTALTGRLAHLVEKLGTVERVAP